MSEEAYKTLIIKHLLGEATSAENQELEHWRTASSENEKLFTDFARIWRTSPKTEPARLPAIDTEWLELASELHFESQRPARVVGLTDRKRTWVQPWRNARYLALAASVLLVLFASLFYNKFAPEDGRVELTAGVGAQEIVELPDGSTVRLNSVSQLSYPAGLSDDERVVVVRGEAFFEIAKDGRPFIVETENARVRVLGTVFNVWARNGETRVIVQEGRVAVRPRESETPASLELTANQMAVCSGESLSGAPVSVDAAHRLGWLEGKIVFSKSPLSEVIAELQRRYQVKIRLSAAYLEQETLTATFNQKPIAEVIESLCLAMHLRFTEDGNSFTIYAID